MKNKNTTRNLVFLLIGIMIGYLIYMVMKRNGNGNGGTNGGGAGARGSGTSSIMINTGGGVPYSNVPMSSMSNGTESASCPVCPTNNNDTYSEPINPSNYYEQQQYCMQNPQAKQCVGMFGNEIG
tara:strand:+ start:18 stop:392 length:375 start_codon:yes stop_codon:yes gene_type:complete